MRIRELVLTLVGNAWAWADIFTSFAGTAAILARFAGNCWGPLEAARRITPRRPNAGFAGNGSFDGRQIERFAPVARGQTIEDLHVDVETDRVDRAVREHRVEEARVCRAEMEHVVES